MSTPDTVTLTAITTDEQRNILAGYANGQTVTDLVAAGRNKKLATALVADVAKFDRGRARQAVLDFDQKHQSADPAPELAGPPRLPRLPRPAAPEAEGGPDEQIDTVVDLLDAAERTEVPRLVKAAGRIREQIAELQAAVATVAREQQLRKDVEQARAAYEQAQAELRRLTGRSAGATGTAPAAQSDKEANRRIRAWAAETGRDVAPRGRIPADVVDAYREAQGDA